MDAMPQTEAELVEQVLSLFAREARIERERLRLDARADELGIESLDLAVALFELEERFGVNITQALPGTPLPTVGDIVQQVMAQRAQRPAAPGGV